MNTRLLDYLGTQSPFGGVQAGGMKYRSTIDHLMRLETIRNGFIKREHVMSFL